MSLFISGGIAGVVAIYQVMRTFNSIYMAIAVLLVYDALLCMDQEVQYMSMLWNILNAVLIGAVSDNT
ncbi:hypothetical protein VTO73DRAFT_13783 [Trametes versicolor]